MASSYMNSLSYEAEIRNCFDVLDEDRTGTITPHALTTLLRSMGHRVTRDEVMAELKGARERRRRRRRTAYGDACDDYDGDGEYNNSDDVDGVHSIENADQIDVDTVLDILTQERYLGSIGGSSSSKAADLRDTFRLFDVDDKGVITVGDLRTVAKEIHSSGGESNTVTGSSSSGLIDYDLLQSMIDTFDRNLTDGINFDQFCRIMGGQP